MCGSDIFLGLIAILFPPLAVWVKRGICSADSLINFALCVLGYIPGLLHAWYIIAITPDPTYEELAQRDAEQGRVTYYYVQSGTGQPRYQPQQGGSRGYGTVNSTPNSQFPGQQQHGFVQPQPAQQAQQAQPAQPQAGASSREEVPPTYAQAVAGDNKIQGS